MPWITISRYIIAAKHYSVKVRGTKGTTTSSKYFCSANLSLLLDTQPYCQYTAAGLQSIPPVPLGPCRRFSTVSICSRSQTQTGSSLFFVNFPQLFLDLCGQGVEKVLLHHQAGPLQLSALAKLHGQTLQTVSS